MIKTSFVLFSQCLLFTALFTFQAYSEDLNIGVISILDGSYSATGIGATNGAKLAEKDFKNYVKDKKIKLFIENDSFSAHKGVNAFNKLTTKNSITALFNVSSPKLGAILGKVNSLKMPVINMGNESYTPLWMTLYS